MTDKSAIIGHFDIAGEDIAALAGFYSAMFGWTILPRGPGYAQVSTPRLDGALVEMPQASLTMGVIVADLDAALASAAGAGGAVVMPATDNGWVRKGQVRDPAGNVLTLIPQ